MTGVVPFPQFIGKAAFDVPAHDARKVIRNFAVSGITQFLAAFAIPAQLVWVRRVVYGFRCLNIHAGMVVKFRTTGCPWRAFMTSSVHGVR